MVFWKLILHHYEYKKDEKGEIITPQIIINPTIREVMLDWSIKEQRIALGWGAVGDVSQCKQEDITQAIKGLYPTRQNSADGGHSLWSFYNEMKIGDLVMLVGKESRRKKVMEVTGKSAEWKPRKPATFDDYQHQREVCVCSDDKLAEWEERWQKAGNSTKKSHSTLLKVSS